MGGTISIADLMTTSGVSFGTSGARGLAAAMTDRVCYAYTAAFLRHLADLGEIRPGGRAARNTASVATCRESAPGSDCPASPAPL